MMPVETPGPGLVQTACRHPWIVVLAIGVWLSAAGVYLRVATPLYSSTAKLQVRPTGLRLIADAPDARPVTDGDSLFLNTERVVLTSTPVLSAALAKAEVERSQFLSAADDRVVYLRKKLRTELGKKDGILTIGLDTPIPAEGVAIVGAVVEAYIAYQSEQTRRTTEDMLRILGEEKVRCEGRISAQMSGMLELKRAAGVASFQPADSPAMQAVQGLKDSLRVSRAETAAAESFHNDAAKAYGTTPDHMKRIEEAEKSGTFLIASELENTQLRWAIADLELKRNELVGEGKYLPNHPQVRAIQGRLDELRPAYVAAAKRRWVAASERESKLAGAIELQQTAAADFARKAAGHGKLEAELHQLERHAEVLGGRLNELKATQSGGAMKVTVLEGAAAGRKPSQPQPIRILAVALVAGLATGAALSHLRERAKPRLHSIQEAKASLALPVLGLVPRISLLPMGGSRSLPARRGPLSNVAEACRTIGAAIHFGQSPAVCRKLVITSPMSGDGKTTVASNLAAVLAESGSRVLLVDADFRHPTLHRVFGIGNQIGLTSVLRGQGPAAAAIQRTAIEGLNVLPSGPVAGRSWQPLYGRRFDELLEELAGQYDHIILDTPAVTSSSDARVVAAACDAVLLVVRIGKTDPRLAESACDGLLSLGARILGVVINAVSGPAARDISYFENSGALALSDRGSLAKARGRGSVANEAARASGQRG